MSADYIEGILCVYTRRGDRGHFSESPRTRIPANRFCHLPKPVRGGQQALDLR
jgi:hypothetical protein